MPWCATATTRSPRHLGLAEGAVVAQARGESLELTARAGRAAYAPGELERSRGEAQETDRVVGAADAVAAHEEVWAEVTVARAASTLVGDPLGPLAVLRDHDAEHHSDHLRTLAAWLDHPGAPTAAARSIHVHPNTMRYRMARIADLAGLDLDDPFGSRSACSAGWPYGSRSAADPRDSDSVASVSRPVVVVVAHELVALLVGHRLAGGDAGQALEVGLAGGAGREVQQHRRRRPDSLREAGSPPGGTCT